MTRRHPADVVRARIWIALLAMTSLGGGPPTAELQELDAVVVDGLRTPADRRAALERSIDLRRRALAAAQERDVETLALDLAESLALVRPALDGTDLFACVGLLDEGERARLKAAVDEAVAALGRVKDSPRAAVLRAIAGARAIDLGLDAGRAAPASTAGLASPTRELLLIANARLRLHASPAEARQWLRDVERSGAADGIRLTARLLAPLARAEVGEHAGLEELRTIDRETRRSGLVERLLAADALARAARALAIEPTDAIESWTDLLMTCPREDAPALRAAIIRRVRTLLTPRSVALDGTRPLPLAAFAHDLAAEDPVGVERALQAAIDATRSTIAPGGLEPLLRYEHARVSALLGSYDEAAHEFRRLALERSGDPVAADAIDLAIEILAELAQVSLADEVARKRATDAIADGLSLHFDHPRRDRWRYLLGELELDRGRLAAARTAFAAASSVPEARAGEALAWLLTASDASSPEDRAAARSAAENALAAAGTPTAGRGELIAGLEARLVNDDRVAILHVDAALAHPLLSAGDVQRALSALLEAQARSAGKLELSAGALAAAARAPRVVRDVIVSLLQPTFGRADDVSEAALAADAARVRGLLPPPEPVVAAMSATERALVARALLADGRSGDALSLTTRLFAEDPGNVEFLLLHARASEEAAPADALAIYRALVAKGPEASRGWWEGQSGELRLVAVGASPMVAEVILTRVNRLRRVDPGLGGERTRSALEAVAAQALERLSEDPSR